MDIFKEIKTLYSDRRSSRTHWQLKILFMLMFNVFFLAMYNASEVRGDVLTIGILFGCSEALGIMFGELILSMVELSNGFIIANFFIILTSVCVKLPGLS